MKDKIALFTTVNEKYIKNAIRCFQLFNENNPDVFDFFIITSDDTTAYNEDLKKNNISVISKDLKNTFPVESSWGWPSESFWYYWAPTEFLNKGYKFSMYVDCDNVCLDTLDFGWLSDNFVLAGSPRMRNDLSEEIDAWYYLKAVSSEEKIKFLNHSFNLINKDSITDINSGVLIFNNRRWVSEKMYESALKLFSKSKDAGYPMTDDDSLLGLLLLVKSKELFLHLSISWNWYYEQPQHKSFGGEKAKILHMAWHKPWVPGGDVVNENIKKGLEIWKGLPKRTIHVIGTPGNPSSQAITIDPFARVSYYLTTYLHRNEWNVEYYGFAESTVECNKKWNCVNLNWKKELATVTDNEPPIGSSEIDKRYSNAIKPTLESRVKRGDIVLFMWSTIVDHFTHLKDKGVKLVDAHIGHYLPSKNTSYHVYASNSLRSWMNAKDESLWNSRWHDVTIPPMAHSSKDYQFSRDKDDYFLFMSRLIADKGLPIVLDLAHKFPNYKFKIAGSGDWSKWSLGTPSNVEFIGYLDDSKRKQYLSKAKGVLTPALYFEPFGLTAVEAAISGTPIITTDWGGYTNNVVHGVTGFRCTHLQEFIEAIENIDQINPDDCKSWGDLHSAETLIFAWEDYIIRVARDHWNDLTPKENIINSFRR